MKNLFHLFISILKVKHDYKLVEFDNWSKVQRSQHKRFVRWKISRRRKQFQKQMKFIKIISYLFYEKIYEKVLHFVKNFKMNYKSWDLGETLISERFYEKTTHLTYRILRKIFINQFSRNYMDNSFGNYKILFHC